MKERQATSTGGKNPQLMTKWSEAEKRPEPTTTRKELSKVALKYEQIISERMKERLSQMGKIGGESYSPIKGRVRPNEPTLPQNTSKRKELAKIANTTRTRHGHKTVHDTDTPFIQFYEICRKNSVDFSARAKYN